MTRNTWQSIEVFGVICRHSVEVAPYCEWSCIWGQLQSSCCITNTKFVSISSCGLLKWDATLEWFNSTSLGLLSLSDSLLSPVTYLGGFLKRSQRKHFHFCSHLTLSNGARWRDSWLEVRSEEGYTISEFWHVGRWFVEACDWTVEM